MTKKTQLKFLKKLHKELSIKSDVYRDKVANVQTHTFSLTGRSLNKAIGAVIDAYFPEASEKQKKNAITGCQPAMNTFIRNVGKEVTKRSKDPKRKVGKVKVTKRSVTAVFYKADTNRYGSVYSSYARDTNYVQNFTNDILEVLNDEFGAVPGKVDKRKDSPTYGQLIEIGAGDIFNLEHAHQRGIVESLIKDGIDNAVKESEKFTKGDVKKFLKHHDVKLSVIRDTKTDKMNVFVGSKIINLEEGDLSKKEKEKLEKALEKAIRELETSGNKLSYMKGSPSFAEIKELDATEQVLDTFRRKKNHRVTKREKVEKGRTKAEDKMSTAKNLGTPLAVKRMRRRKSKKAKGGVASTPLQLVASLNKTLPATLRKNMRDPALVNRTGRFADSVEVTDVLTTRKGFPSVGYTYDRENYGQFEATSGSKQFASQQRDPRKLIDKSIREIAAKAAIGRLFTRRN